MVDPCVIDIPNEGIITEYGVRGAWISVSVGLNASSSDFSFFV